MDDLEIEYTQKLAKETTVIRKYLTEYSKHPEIDRNKTHYVWKDLLDESKLSEETIKRKYPNKNGFLSEKQIPKNTLKQKR